MIKIISLLLFILAIGCASNNTDFSKIKEGMDKDEVLQHLGSPLRTEKNSIREKWAYRYYTGAEKDVEVLKYVEFMNGRVVSYGDDIEEQKRLETFKDNETKKQNMKKKKEEVDEKVEKAYGR